MTEEINVRWIRGKNYGYSWFHRLSKDNEERTVCGIDIPVNTKRQYRAELSQCRECTKGRGFMEEDD